MSIVTVYIPSPYNVFLYFLEGQVHKDSKLEIMTNMAFYIRDYKEETIKLLPFYMTDFLFTEL